jgi:hypothetical protein
VPAKLLYLSLRVLEAPGQCCDLLAGRGKTGVIGRRRFGLCRGRCQFERLLPAAKLGFQFFETTLFVGKPPLEFGQARGTGLKVGLTGTEASPALLEVPLGRQQFGASPGDGLLLLADRDVPGVEILLAGVEPPLSGVQVLPPGLDILLPRIQLLLPRQNVSLLGLEVLLLVLQTVCLRPRLPLALSQVTLTTVQLRDLRVQFLFGRLQFGRPPSEVLLLLTDLLTSGVEVPLPRVHLLLPRVQLLVSRVQLLLPRVEISLPGIQLLLPRRGFLLSRVEVPPPRLQTVCLRPPLLLTLLQISLTTVQMNRSFLQLLLGRLQFRRSPIEGLLLLADLGAAGIEVSLLHLELLLPRVDLSLAGIEILLAGIEALPPAVEVPLSLIEVQLGGLLPLLKELALLLERLNGSVQLLLAGIEFGLKAVESGALLLELALIGRQLHQVLLEPGREAVRLSVPAGRRRGSLVGIRFGHAYLCLVLSAAAPGAQAPLTYRCLARIAFNMALSSASIC